MRYVPMRYLPVEIALTIVFTLASAAAVAASLSASVVSIPVGSTLQLTRELSVNHGADSVLLGENKLQAGFNKGFQWNNQRLGQIPLSGSTPYIGNSFIDQINRTGESAQQS